MSALTHPSEKGLGVRVVRLLDGHVCGGEMLGLLSIKCLGVRVVWVREDVRLGRAGGGVVVRVGV